MMPTGTNKVILDPSGMNIPDEGYLQVHSEVDFLRNDGTGDIWVSGSACDFVRRICKARNVRPIEIDSPENELRLIVGGIVDRLSPAVLKKCLDILGRLKVHHLADILEELTADDLWGENPSYSHAARLLTSDIPDDLSALVEKQVQQWARNSDETLSNLYSQALGNRSGTLRYWLMDPQARQVYGEFPIKLTGKHAASLQAELAQQLRLSKGLAIDSFPITTPNKHIYGRCIVDYFSLNAAALSVESLAKVRSLLSINERNALMKLLPSSEIEPLPLSASVEQTLDWAIETYFSERSAQSQDGKVFDADSQAASFANWILETYPALTHVERETSPLNIRPFYEVQKLAKTHWVLWVVVDGLSYPNHQKLLALLATKSMSLRALENVPLISILPTITERAKYSLTTGKFPDENADGNWNTKSNFLSEFPDGIYAGNSGMSTLADGLKCGEIKVCYWNYTKIDKCHHEHVDSSYLTHEVDAHLESLASHINRMVSTAHCPEKVAVIISTDHGQLVANCGRIDLDQEGVRAHGRTILHDPDSLVDMTNAYSKDLANQTALLNPKSFRLGEPTTVALGSTFFVTMTEDKSGDAIGLHGGLYPEEVIVGMAVLVSNPEYLPVVGVISGEGESGQESSIRLLVDNPNRVAVQPLSLTINDLTIRDQGELATSAVRPMSTLEIDISVDTFPQPTAAGDVFEVEGILAYQFDDGHQETAILTGQLRCNSLYKPKNPSLLDRFKA